MKKTLIILIVGLSLMACKAKQPVVETKPVETKQRQGGPSFERISEKMDLNKDGKISKTEAKSRILNQFDRMDTNQDGFVTKEEFDLFMKEMEKRRKQ